MSACDEAVHLVFGFVGHMFDHVDEQLADAVNALLNGDEQHTAKVRQLDREVDILELNINRECERILSTHSPQGSALRMVIAAMRISANLERIGDQCKNIASHATHLQDMAHWRTDTPLIEIADAVRIIVRGAREALSRKDRLKARKVTALDLRIDRAYRKLIAALIELCRANPDRAESIIRLSTVGKSLERIADNAKSVAKSVVYLVEGVDIRHMVWQQPQETNR